MTSWTTGSQGHGHPGPPRSFLLAVPPGAAAHNTGCVSITEGDQQGPGTLGVPAPGAGSLHCLPPLPQECRREHWAWGPTPWVPGGLALHMSLGTCRPGSLCPTSPRAQQQGPAAAAEEGHPGPPTGTPQWTHRPSCCTWQADPSSLPPPQHNIRIPTSAQRPPPVVQARRAGEHSWRAHLSEARRLPLPNRLRMEREAGSLASRE